MLDGGALTPPALTDPAHGALVQLTVEKFTYAPASSCFDAGTYQAGGGSTIAQRRRCVINVASGISNANPPFHGQLWLKMRRYPDYTEQCTDVSFSNAAGFM